MSGLKDISEKLNSFNDDRNLWVPPVILNLQEPKDLEATRELFERGKIFFVHDQIKAALDELYYEENPAQKDQIEPKSFDAFIQQHPQPAAYGVWVYFPWRAGLVHFPPKQDFIRLVTSRNRNLVETHEQTRLFDATVAVFGLSVGSNVVDAMVNQGLGGSFILVDLDVLDPTNLNRIRASYSEVGVSKVDVVAKKLSEANPYIELALYRNGLDLATLDDILDQKKPDILVDEMDDIKMKILVRRRAQALKKPVLMATDNSDGAILDIERYDSQPDTQIFNGLIPDKIIEDLENNKLSRAESGSLIGKHFVGFDRVSLRMIKSLQEVGKSLPSWPQLGSAAALSGLLVAYATKKIILGHEFSGTRFEINFEKLLPTTDNRPQDDEKHTAIEGLTGDA